MARGIDLYIGMYQVDSLIYKSESTHPFGQAWPGRRHYWIRRLCKVRLSLLSAQYLCFIVLLALVQLGLWAPDCNQIWVNPYCSDIARVIDLEIGTYQADSLPIQLRINTDGQGDVYTNVP